MTTKFETIIEGKKAAVIKVLEGIQDLMEQPSLDFPPEADLRRLSSAELVYLIALKNQVEGLKATAEAVQETVFNHNSRINTLRETFLTLGKCDDSKGGASMGW